MMKITGLIFLGLACAACSGLDTGGMTGQQRAARNLCEATRSYQPYRPGDCVGYGAQVDTTPKQRRERTGF